MKLVELEPRWVGLHRGSAQCGISFRCPCRAGCAERLHILFDVALDGTAVVGAKTWQRTGDTFAMLTLSPSIDASASASGHWHGHIIGGEMR